MTVTGYLFVVLTILFGQIICYNVEDETRKSTQFSLDFYKNMFNQHENTIVSPFSFRILLSVLYQSATGISEIQLRDKVYLGEKEETYNSQLQYLSRYNSNANLKIVSKIYLKNTGTLKPQFLAIVDGLKGHIEQVDFSQSVATTNKMNTWVEEQTNGLIKNLVSSDIITPDTALFLLNTLYFKADWKNPFSPESIYDGPFTDIDDHVHQIKQMNDVGYYKVARVENIHARVLEIPYTDDSNFVFWILLPNENSNIVQLKNSLSPNVISEINQNFRSSYFDICVPLIEIETSVNGVDELKKLGLQNMFKKAEFDMLEHSTLLLVDDVKQKSRISVTTAGTEAASATFFKVTPDALFPQFNINRPFIYMILAADTKEPVFIGHYSKPI